MPKKKNHGLNNEIVSIEFTKKLLALSDLLNVGISISSTFATNVGITNGIKGDTNYAIFYIHINGNVTILNSKKEVEDWYDDIIAKHNTDGN